jgi:histone H3/H4
MTTPNSSFPLPQNAAAHVSFNASATTPAANAPSSLPGTASTISVGPGGGSNTAASAASKNKKKVTAKKATGPAATKAKAPKKPSVARSKKAAGTSGAGGGAATKKATGGNSSGASASVSAAAIAAANAEMINADATIARLDLAKQRSIAIQRKSDPLWYRIEDVMFLPSQNAAFDSMNNIPNNILPEQITIVERALSHAGGFNRSDVTPQAMLCLMEQARRITYELITDAQDYAYAAGRADINVSDLILAQELRSDLSSSANITTQLPKLNISAPQINRIPLPPIPIQCYTGIVLPPKEHQLTARTFDVVSASMVAQKMTQPVPKSPLVMQQQQQQQQQQLNRNKQSSASTGGYGASRGRQIPITLKNSSTNATATSEANATSPNKSTQDVERPLGATSSTSLSGTATTTQDMTLLSSVTPMDYTVIATQSSQHGMVGAMTNSTNNTTNIVTSTVTNATTTTTIGATSSTNTTTINTSNNV